MYIITEKERLPQGRHYETLPDGRCIVGGSEAKMMDTLEGVTVVPTSEALERLRRQVAREMGLTDEVQQDDDTAEAPDGEVTREGAADTAADEDESDIEEKEVDDEDD